MGRYHCRLSDLLRDGVNRSTSESQSLIIHCLRSRLEKLDHGCLKTLLHIAEEQSKDYHLDPLLYNACREDRKRLCSNVESGEGRVYECLRKHMNNDQMSLECRKEIFERQLLVASDYLIDFRFAKACAHDITNAKCIASDKSGASLSHLMLCLESVEKPRLTNQNVLIQSRPLQPACKAELVELRRVLLEDYRLSPDLMLHCSSTIERHCAKRKRTPRTMLHCLLRVINTPAVPADRPPEKCIGAVHDLIKLTDVQENVLLDPVISHVCHSVLTGKCAADRSDHGQAFECLFAHQEDPTMTVSCRVHIRELYYFITRDITLDDQLIRACTVDAGKLCALPKQLWTDRSKPDPFLLTCLYNHRSGQEISHKNLTQHLSHNCESEVLRVVHGRAKRVAFEPRVFEVCLADLAAFCDAEEEDYIYPSDEEDAVDEEDESREQVHGRNEHKKGSSGMDCLQRHLNSLQPGCRAAVVTVSAEAEDDPNLDKLVNQACLAAEQRFCSGFSDPNHLFNCLIRHKNHPEMNDPCRAAIEHVQRVALQDFEISKQFRLKCQADAEKHCASEIPKGTAAVIACLSGKFTIYRLQAFYRMFKHSSSPPPPMSHACMEQLVLELRERSESINLDPELSEACEQDRARFCASVKSGNARVIRCLQHHRNQISDKCHAKLFERDELAAVENRADYSLMQVCEQMIRVHCTSVMAHLQDMGESDFSSTSVAHHQVFECLTDAMNQPSTAPTFDPYCRRHLWDTMMVRSQDYRLDPELQVSCYPDIKKYCRKEAEATLRSSFERNGPVLHCLKKHFAEIKRQDQMLSTKCYQRVRLLITWENAVYHLDPVLVGACKHDVLINCRSTISDTNMGPEKMDNSVRECLLTAFQQGKLQSDQCAQEIVLAIREGQADIHVDPVLHRACAVELNQVCKDVMPGQGRQMTCLVQIMDRPDAKEALGPICLGELMKRRQLWDHVVRFQTHDDLRGLVEQVKTSRSRNILLVSLFVFLTIIFSCGLCCGRVTKRVPVDVKTK
ncbi:Golgi apparatus protein 1 [Fasciola gigantica]|uniref:Golgi apparatus protein 1 n=1 Tax=Fasciola gigantica TaxID=46835 RepID=A0A504YW69_FASGI|nr:Golgi apparatus protein 1 [Fasciola gigantica]